MVADYTRNMPRNRHRVYAYTSLLYVIALPNKKKQGRCHYTGPAIGPIFSISTICRFYLKISSKSPAPGSKMLYFFILSSPSLPDSSTRLRLIKDRFFA